MFFTIVNLPFLKFYLINIINHGNSKSSTQQAKIKLASLGLSGYGKTLSSLLLASGKTDYSKIAVIDIENHSAELYAHLADYNVLQLSKTFTDAANLL